MSASQEKKNQAKEGFVTIIRIKPPVSRPMSEVKRSRKSMIRDTPLTYIVEIRPGGPVKIGKTVDIIGRLAEAACFNDQLKLLATFEEYEDTSEKALHKLFADCRIQRELFDGDIVRAWLAARES